MNMEGVPGKDEEPVPTMAHSSKANYTHYRDYITERGHSSKAPFHNGENSGVSDSEGNDHTQPRHKVVEEEEVLVDCEDSDDTIVEEKEALPADNADQPYICFECGETFDDKLSLKLHSESHASENYAPEFKCMECGDIFRDAHSLRQHAELHVADKSDNEMPVGSDMEFDGSRELEQTVMGNSKRKKPKRQYLKNSNDPKAKECPICNKVFSTVYVMKNHMEIHTGEKSHSCSICGKSFSAKRYLDKHFGTHSTLKLFKCSVCEKAFRTAYYLRVHTRLHTGDLPYGCDVCGKSFNVITELKVHMRNHTGEKPFKCSVCGTGFIAASYLRTHMRIHTGEKPFECKICGRRFGRGTGLRSHMARHIDHTKHKCHICDKGFPQLEELEAHINTVHEGKKPEGFKEEEIEEVYNHNGSFEDLEKREVKSEVDDNKLECHQSPKDEFDVNASIKPEVKDEIPSSEDRFTVVCHICDAVIDGVRDLIVMGNGEKHLECSVCKTISNQKPPNVIKEEEERTIMNSMHNAEQIPTPRRRKKGRRSNICPYCDRAFAPTYLKVHMEIHSGLKPYKCEICGKAFNARRYLTKHLETHKEVKKYRCVICDKTFGSKYYLKIHTSVHTGQKAFSCDICGKQFNIRPELNTHMRVHTGEKPYACSLCDRAFISGAYLRSHMKIHTGEKRHECPMCDKKFSRSNDLKIHVTTHTGEKPYQCLKCGKGFNRSGEIDAHMKNSHESDLYNYFHNGETESSIDGIVNTVAMNRNEEDEDDDETTSLICPICDKAFSRKVHLKAHMRTHTGERPYMCYICNKSFPENGKLKRHLKVHEKEASGDAESQDQSS